MKRLFGKGLCFVLLFALIFTMGVVPANASNEKDSSGFYLTTSTVPQEAINYAAANVFDFLVSRSSIDKVDIYNVTMGVPFTIAKENISDDDVFYFPIYSGEKVVYTFRVYMDNGNFTGILSPYIAKELNSYMDETSKSSPLSIFINNGNVMASINGSVEILEEVHDGYNPVANKSIFKRPFSDEATGDIDVVDIANTIDFNVTPIPRAVASKDLTLDMKETQGQQSWCAAFAMASILRYKGAGSSVTAKAIMQATFPKSKDLEKEEISRSQLVSYAKDKGYKNTKESSSTLSNSTVVSEIYTNTTPIYAGCAGSGSYAKARHALVICGYNNTKETYTVWNPWYNYTETISQSTKTYKVNSSSSFKWDVSIYQVRK